MGLFSMAATLPRTLFDSVIWSASSLFEIFTVHWTLYVVRIYIDTLGKAYRMFWFNVATDKFGPKLCVDGVQPRTDVKIEFGIPYGDKHWERMDIATRSQYDTALDPPVVLYLHGGGFVACNSDVMMHSLSIPLARAGARSYSMNYPLSPDEKYPAAVLSTMKALVWVKVQTGAKEVVLMGDSAGGCIAATTATIASSADLLQQLSTETGIALTEWDIPKISKLISIYGVLDRVGWSNRRNPETGLIPKMKWNDKIGAAVLRFCLRCYGAETKFLGGKCILSDFSADDLRTIPDTLLICGSSDPLIFGNRHEYERIQGIGRKIELHEFPGHHAFIGFPISWNFKWQENAWPAYVKIVEFIGLTNAKSTQQWPRHVPFDWVLPVSVVLCLCVLPFIGSYVVVVATANLMVNLLPKLRRKFNTESNALQASTLRPQRSKPPSRTASMIKLA